ncbi:amino acid adenylation domain-containing protein [Ilyonectria destructans]|nr:amino acid adenylation domain-containing protein [Ilyonectria destructans]
MSVQLLEIPGGISFYHTSEEESRWLYDEIVKDHCYDIGQLPSDPFIIDIGANIGLYCLYIKKTYPAAQILAFEPAPESVSILRQNLALHKISGVEAHACALGSKTDTQILTFFPNTPSNATLFSDEKDKYLDLIAKEVSQDIADRMSHGARQYPVSVKRLSQFLQGRVGFQKIDLIKIDVEGGELEVLRGIDDEHWPLIQNIVMEVWDSSGQLGDAEKFLMTKGFTVESALVPWINGRAEMLKMYMVKARRSVLDTK